MQSKDGQSKKPSVLVRAVVLTLLALVCAAGAAAVVVLSRGFTDKVTLAGPFNGEAGTQLLNVPVPERSLICCGTLASDGPGHEDVSRLRLWVNGAEVVPAHALHESIRNGQPGFSHWGEQVLFSLPPGVANDATASITIGVPLTINPVLLVLLSVLSGAAAIAFAVLLYRWRPALRLVPRTPRSAADTAPRGSLALTSVGIGLNIALAFLILGAVVSRTLAAGVWQQTEIIEGPFAAESGAAFTFPIAHPKTCCLSAKPDDVKNVRHSDLRLWINETEITPAHVSHADLRAGQPGFSHWGGSVIFSLPAKISNSSTVQARASYSLKPPTGLTTVLSLLALALGAALHGKKIAKWLGGSSKSLRIALRLPYQVLSVASWIALAACGVYIAIMIWGFATGEALPSTIPFRSETVADITKWLDPALPLLIVTLACAGVAFGWGASRLPSSRLDIKRHELGYIRWLRRYGLLVLVVWELAAVGATWSGLFRTGQTSSIVGLVPFFDAAGYFSDTSTFLRDGFWTEFTSRRPLAGAFRTSLSTFGGMNFPVVAVFQAVGTGIAIFWGAMSIIRWRGVWAAMIYIALTYTLARGHVATNMVEPFAIVVSLCSTPFFVESLRRKSKMHGLIGVFLLSTAIWMRPGAMFLIPALTLWFAFFFGKTLASKARMFALVCAPILAMMTFEAGLGKLFGIGSPGNLSYSLCGLTLGGGWSACLEKFEGEPSLTGARHDAERMNEWQYAQAWRNIQADPGPLIRTMTTEPLRYLAELPNKILSGYSDIPVPEWFPPFAFVLAAAVIVAASLRKRSLRTEGPFWTAVLGGLLTSATMFYLSDGVRAFSVSYVLVALFVALAFVTPSSFSGPAQAVARREARSMPWAIGAMAALLVVTPYVGRVFLSGPRAGSPFPAGTNEMTAVVSGGPQSSGVLVVADGAPLPHGVPSVHFSRFADYVRQSGVERSQPIVTPTPPPLPFGFMITRRFDSGGSLTIITPPEMLTRKDVNAWAVKYVDWGAEEKPRFPNWFRVSYAEPYVAAVGN